MTASPGKRKPLDLPPILGPVVSLARCSTKEQSLAVQAEKIAAWAVREGLDPASVAVIPEEGISGAAKVRPGIDAILDAAQAGRVKTLVVVALDRLGRDLGGIIRTMEALSALGVRVVSLRESIDYATPAGRAMVHMVGVFAQLERDINASRSTDGRAAQLARFERDGAWTTAKGEPCQPPGNPAFRWGAREDEQLRDLVQSGTPMRKLGGKIKVVTRTGRECFASARKCQERWREIRG